MITTLALAATLLCGGFTEGEVEELATGFMFTEGPLWLPQGKLIFSDIPASTIFFLDKEVFRRPSGQSNGLTLDKNNQVIAAEHRTRRVTRLEADGSLTALARTYEGKRFNSPNDVVVRGDGMLFFTDPPYGLRGGLDGPESELGFCGVYALMPGQEPKLLVKDFVRPNGLALSPDEKTLYVADTQEGHIRAFAAAEDGTLSQDRKLCEIPGPDGMKVDVEGRIWCTAADGVRVISPEGELLETIVFPAIPANCAFGGPDFKTLYVTARRAVYKVPVTVAGIPPGAPEGDSQE